MPPCLVISEPSEGKLVFKCDNCKERSLVLGEEHMEILPNGEGAKVREHFRRRLLRRL